MRIGLLVSTCLAAICSANAIAQETADSESVAESEAQEDARKLDAVVVTAQKRAQNIQDVSLSISAVGGEKIEETGADNLADLSGFVPGLLISKGTINTNIYIRGVGSGINRAFEQSVGMYVDGVYMGRGRQFRSPFLDVERVEVLRGPQGILFGRNTVAGAVNIISRSPVPGEELSGSFEATWEPEFDTQEYVGVLSGGIGDTTAARLAVKYRTSDGFVENLTAGRDEPAVEEFTARGTFVWEPTSNINTNLKVTYSEHNVDGNNAIPRVFALIADPAAGLAPLTFGAVASGLADPSFAGGREDWQTWRNVGGPNGSVGGPLTSFGLFPDQNNTESFNASFRTDWDVENGTFTAITGWSEYDTEDGLDADYLPVQFLHRDDTQSFEQFSQEVRFVSDFEGPFNFIAGAYYDTQELKVFDVVSLDGTLGGLASPLLGGLDTTLLGPALGLPISFNLTGRVGEFNQDADSWAVFSELRYDLTDKLRVTGGLRYSEVEKDINKMVFPGADITGGLLVQPDPDDGGLGTLIVGANAALFATTPHTLTASRTESHLDPSIKLEYDFSDDILFYASYSEGYKGGGFNSASDLAFTGTTGFYFPPGTPAFGPFSQGEPIGLEYEDESASSFEVGVKSEFGGNVRLNASAFFTDYEDLQVAAFQGTSFVVGNAASAEIAGVELETEWAITDNLRIGGSAAYLDFEYADYEEAACTVQQTANINAAFVDPSYAGGPLSDGLCSTGPNVIVTATGFPSISQNLEGQVGVYAPEWNGNLFAAYERPVSDNLLFTASADVNWSTEYFLDSDLDPNALQDDYAKVNFRLAIGDQSDRWEVALFGRNITDEAVFSYSVDTPLVNGSHTAAIEEPAIYGVSTRFSF